MSQGNGQAEAAAAPPRAGEAAMRVNRLSVGFGGTDVLSDVDLEFPRNTVNALLGPTGSGKTTFLRTLNRMNDRVSGFRHRGEVLLEGEDVFGGGFPLMLLRRRVGMLFQRPNPFPMSIQDNVVAGVRAHGLARRGELKEIAERRLREVGLWDAVSGRLGSSPFQLSGGQQQLLCLARALAVEPEVLLLDEPTSSLDPVATEAIEQLIRQLAPALTIVMVTHNLGQASRVADTTAFFYQGRLVEHGPTSRLFEAPEHEETARYISGRIG